MEMEDAQTSIRSRPSSPTKYPLRSLLLTHYFSKLSEVEQRSSRFSKCTRPGPFQQGNAITENTAAYAQAAITTNIL